MAGRHKKKEAGTEITLPITPMLDMSFQLLFFFISTFKLPTGMEGSLDLNLPSQATAAADTIQNVNTKATSDTDPLDLPSEITIKVETQAQGTDPDGISRISVEGTVKGESVKEDVAQVKDLTAKLTEIAAKADKDTAKTTVKIEGASALKWRGVVKVMDACRAAHLPAISFAQPPDYATYSH